MLAPKKQKYRKFFRGKNRGLAGRGSSVDFGDYGLKALAGGLISAAQIEAARKAISHHTKREGKVWVRIFPDKATTAKSAGVGMGAGKGDIKEYVAVVKPGRILFELAGVVLETAQDAFDRASAKLSIKTKMVSKL